MFSLPAVSFSQLIPKAKPERADSYVIPKNEIKRTRVHENKTMHISNYSQPVPAPKPGVQTNSTSETRQTAVTATDNTAGTATPSTAQDTLTLSTDRSIIVQQVVTQQVSIALNINASSGSTSGSDDIVDTVLQKIDDDSAEAEDSDGDEHDSDIASQVRLQFEQGISRATTVLSQAGILDKTAVGTIEQTRSQVNQAIDNVGTNNPPGDPATATAPTQNTSIDAASAKRTLDSSVQITTREGDVVTIDLSRSQSFSTGSIDTADSTAMFASASSSSQLSLSIQGELNDKENEAIEKIIKRVNNLAEKMFDGKLGNALEKLGEFEINTEQLSGMALNMSSSVSYAAVSAYTEVSNLAPVDDATPASSTTATAPATPATPVPVDASATEPASTTVTQAVQDTAAVIDTAVQTNSFDNPYLELRKIFTAIANDLTAFSDNAYSVNQDNFVKQLFNDVVDRFENDGDDHDADDRTPTSASASQIMTG